MDYTDGLNALVPDDVAARLQAFEKAANAMSDAELETILREVAPGNPFAEKLLATQSSMPRGT